MGKYDAMSRDPGNGNHVTPVNFLILIKLGTHTNKKFASNISLHTNIHSGLHVQHSQLNILSGVAPK